MAYYFLISPVSMTQRQKENLTSYNKPKLAINIITPNNETIISEKLAFSQTINKDY
jgi:hypothetical protein